MPIKRKTISKLAKRKSAKSAGSDGGGASPLPLKRGKTVEQIYQKKTQTEHILLRPDTYVGSVEKQDDQMWVWNSEKSEMESRYLSYVPALYKIFDEILVNAADNLQRDSKMNTISVEIDKKQGRIKVWNNGKGLPIQIHKEHKVFVPELVFGHLLTSDNYDDTEKKVTGGRNGFGAKLTNIFSTRFTVETANRGKRYKQKWTSNMSRKEKPEIKK
jgi:DNA topoisomerase-2